MASLSGSLSESKVRRTGPAACPTGWLLLGLLLVAAPALAGNPAYLREALAGFDPAVPGGWAYTLKTERDGRQTVERCDPAKAAAAQWTLLLTDGRPPTSAELEKYAKYKAGQAGGATEGSFRKSDIEPGSLVLVSEDSRWAEYRGAFREQAANSDKMLGHLALLLRICKQPAYVEKYTLVLRDAYSPVLGVKMKELTAEMIFTAPTDDRPVLPWRNRSHFRGRLFFWPITEDLRLTYSDFVRPPSRADRDSPAGE